MFLSKLVFGSGKALVEMAKTIIFARYFYGKELSFANNTCQALCREMTFVSSVLTPIVTVSYGLNQAFSFGAAICAVSLLTVIPLVRMERC
jgi:hypothetical protein